MKKTTTITVTLDPINLSYTPARADYDKVVSRMHAVYRAKHKRKRDFLSFRLKFDHRPTKQELRRAMAKRSRELIGLAPYVEVHGECMTADLFWRHAGEDYNIVHWLHSSRRMPWREFDD